MIVLQILLAVAVAGLLWWLWEMNGRSRTGGAVALAALAAFAWPWAVAADWAAVGLWLAGTATVGVLVLAYARLIARIRATVRERDGG